MKILYLTNIPSPYRVDFFNELGKYCELLVLFERENAGDRDKRWKAENFINFKAVFLNGRKVGTDASFCPSVIRYLKKGYDAIILGGYSSPTYMMAMDYMRIRRIPFLMNADGGMIKEDKSSVYKLKKHYISSAQGWLSTGRKTDQYLSHYGAKKEKIYHYPFTSVKQSELYRPTEEEKVRIKRELDIGGERMILSVGQFIPRKGMDLLIKTAGRIQNQWEVYLVGGKPDEQYLDLVTQCNAANVHFVDFMEKTKLRMYYLAADIFVFPTREDIWGLVLNEAMSNGLPCIASSKANASYELIEDGVSGYIVNPEDTKEMAEKIEVLLSDDLLRTRMGENGFNKMSGFTIEKMAEAHMEMIKRWKNDCREEG